MRSAIMAKGRMNRGSPSCSTDSSRRSASPTGGMGRHRAGLGWRPAGLALEGKGQVDVVFLNHGQGDQGMARRLLDGPQGSLQAPLAGGGDDEPEVEAVFPLVVVIDLGKPVHRFRHAGQLFRRHRHGGQGRSAQAFGGEDGADPGDLALVAQAFQGAQHHPLGHAEAGRQLGEGSRAEGKVPLEFVEEAQF